MAGKKSAEYELNKRIYDAIYDVDRHVEMTSAPHHILAFREIFGQHQDLDEIENDMKILCEDEE